MDECVRERPSAGLGADRFAWKWYGAGMGRYHAVKEVEGQGTREENRGPGQKKTCKAL